MSDDVNGANILARKQAEVDTLRARVEELAGKLLAIRSAVFPDPERNANEDIVSAVKLLAQARAENRAEIAALKAKLQTVRDFPEQLLDANTIASQRDEWMERAIRAEHERDQRFTVEDVAAWFKWAYTETGCVLPGDVESPSCGIAAWRERNRAAEQENKR